MSLFPPHTPFFSCSFDPKNLPDFGELQAEMEKMRARRAENEEKHRKELREAWERQQAAEQRARDEELAVRVISVYLSLGGCDSLCFSSIQKINARRSVELQEKQRREDALLKEAQTRLSSAEFSFGEFSFKS